MIYGCSQPRELWFIDIHVIMYPTLTHIDSGVAHGGHGTITGSIFTQGATPGGRTLKKKRHNNSKKKQKNVAIAVSNASEVCNK